MSSLSPIRPYVSANLPEEDEETIDAASKEATIFCVIVLVSFFGAILTPILMALCKDAWPLIVYMVWIVIACSYVYGNDFEPHPVPDNKIIH